MLFILHVVNLAHPKFSGTHTMAKSPKLLDQVRDKLRVKHYSIRTEQSYTDWIKRYILFHGKRHPKYHLFRATPASLRSPH